MAMPSEPATLDPRQSNADSGHPIEDAHVETIAALRARAKKRTGHHQRIVERIARQLGRPRAIYALLAFIATWVSVNLALPNPFDKAPFFALQGLLTVYAALVTTAVLTVQTRQQKEGEHQASVQLQLNLAAEHKAAKIIELLEELRRDLPNVQNRRDTQAELLSRAVDTEKVAVALEEKLLVPEGGPPSTT